MDAKIQESDGSKHEQGSKSKRPLPVTVKIVERQGESVLCAWMDGKLYKRAYVPADKLKGNDVAASVLAKCPAYGLDWAAKFAQFPNADAIANELRRQNIWTADDFRHGRANVVAAFQRIIVNPLLTEIVKEF